MYPKGHESVFYQNIISLYGEYGQQWINQLAEQIAYFERLWRIHVGKPYPNLSYNFIASAETAAGTPAVLKLGFPNKELSSEIEALNIYAGRGCAALLAADADRGALLLKRALPGEPLKTAVGDDDQATRIAADVMRILWRDDPELDTFPTVAKWGMGFQRLRAAFGGVSGPFPELLVAKAETIFTEYLANCSPGVLLHGDLHHENILSDEQRGWVGIDPKGVIGEPAYEVGALLRNIKPSLLYEGNLQQICDRRAAILAEELGFERERIIGWGFAQAVLSAWWDYEDHGRVGQEVLKIAQTLFDMLY